MNGGGATGFGLAPAPTRMMYQMVGNDGCFSFLPLSHTLVVVLFWIVVLCFHSSIKLIYIYIYISASSHALYVCGEALYFLGISIIILHS